MWWTWAVASPAARSKLVGPAAGQVLAPCITVSRVAGRAASRPSRSAPSRRGAETPCRSATASAAALVATMPADPRTRSPKDHRRRRPVSGPKVDPPWTLSIVQVTNGYHCRVSADLCLNPGTRPLTQTWTAVITRPALDDSDPHTGRRLRSETCPRRRSWWTVGLRHVT
jgi:hypothetical protein